MTPTLLEGRASLYAVLDVNPNGVDAVYDHEPGREASGPCYVTISLERITSTEQLWGVRIYRQWADGIEDATTGWLQAIASVDDLLKAKNLGPSEWESGAVDELQALVARSFVEIPRESF